MANRRSAYAPDLIIFDGNGRLIGDLPGKYSFIAPEMMRSMLQGEFDQRLYMSPQRRVPRYANALPRNMWNGPCLIDYERWEDVYRKLRKQGVVLPFDYMFEPDREEDTSARGSRSMKADVQANDDVDVENTDSGPSQEASEGTECPQAHRSDQEDSEDGSFPLPGFWHLIQGFIKKTALLL
ncbi:hypothetical protein CC80DRAFT_573132 [Byssothecium circinans]|uniref:Uncharacterized protein n=1 Tax=Byssothecium circinans TaxID=147558 RepID=A0A6A5TIR0_9PLEO|nr:hypothetical protein CC80DRAFT_573132 [Byssothecium circinans]